MLILVAHGSRDQRWRASVEEVVRTAQRELEPGELRLAYMDLAPPTLLDVVADAARGGVRRVRVLPLFLATEGHVERDVRPLVDAARAAYPALAIELLPPFGQLPHFRDALRGIVRNGAASAGGEGGVEGGVAYLVGAGPGDPGLITLRGSECLQRADVVLYDYLVNPALLEHAAPGADLIPLGRRTTGRNLTPEQITTLMIDEARAGRTVVRLKAGDPSVFGRGADEEGALRDAGVRYEIVPGITAGLAVAAYAEIPVTHYADASAVALVTGRERDGKAASSLDYGALASFPGTLVFYMGVARTEEWSAALMACGKSPDTPVAIVRWCTRSEQQRFRCTLGTVAAFIGERGIRPPAVVVVGEVVARAPDRTWFEARPLFGVRVLVPGPPAATSPLRDRLTRLGADAVIDPADYGRRDAEEPDPDIAAALTAGEIGWVAVIHADAARSLVRLYGAGLSGARLAAMDPTASAALRESGFEPAIEATPHTTAALVDAILRAEGRDRSPAASR